MAINGGARFSVQHDEVFPKGALVMGVEPITKFQSAEDKARGRALEPETDKITGERLWAVLVIDQAAERKTDAVVTVKIAAPYQPTPPEAISGTDVRPMIFEGLTVTPWVDDKACRPGPAGQASVSGSTRLQPAGQGHEIGPGQHPGQGHGGGEAGGLTWTGSRGNRNAWSPRFNCCNAWWSGRPLQVTMRSSTGWLT